MNPNTSHKKRESLEVVARREKLEERRREKEKEKEVRNFVAKWHETLPLTCPFANLISGKEGGETRKEEREKGEEARKEKASAGRRLVCTIRLE